LALEREIIRIDTRFGRLNAKKVIDPQGRARIVPEYEVCRKAAREYRVPLRDVYEEVHKSQGTTA
jgi:uncharacterized protein (DUF111 family)